MLADRTGLTPPTVNAALRSLEQAGVVRELTGKQRGRLFGTSVTSMSFSEGTTAPPGR